MMPYSPSAPAAAPTVQNVFRQMLPITPAMFVGFLAIGLPLPVLHLHSTLGMSPLVVGIAIGSQFAAANPPRPAVSKHPASRMARNRSGRAI
jgi:hypothetical protein